jgi:small subunit ribosomal protein S21
LAEGSRDPAPPDAALAEQNFKNFLKEGLFLPEVYIGTNESFDQSLKRFNKLVQQSGILAEARRREHYEPPSVYRKKKAAAKRRKSLKNSQRG